MTTPVIVIEPNDNERDVAVQTPIRVTLYDAEDSFTGINPATVEISYAYDDAGDVRQEIYAVKAGDLRPQVIGEKTGSPTAPTGVRYSFAPRVGRWEPRTVYSIHAYGEDDDANPVTADQQFRTDSLKCYEDLLPASTALEQMLLSSFPQRNLDVLRGVLLPLCTTSTILSVQAHTVIYVAALTELRTMLTEVIDVTALRSVWMNQRRPISEIYNTLQRYWKAAAPAMREVPHLDLPSQDLLLRYLGSDSIVHAVGAATVAVVLTAHQQIA